MPISEKTRKVLWARSGNRCAICRKRLVVDETEHDSESVVGEECHIVSRAPNGPRHDSAFPSHDFDLVANLILLCAVHHKMVDDQFETYTSDELRKRKAVHEAWVESKLKDSSPDSPVRIRRFRGNIPNHLEIVKSGQQLLAAASTCDSTSRHHDDRLSDREVEVVGGFLQNLQDYMDIWLDIEPMGQLRAARVIDDQLQELSELGFHVFSAVEQQQLEGGAGSPIPWFALHISVVRASDPTIIRRPPES